VIESLRPGPIEIRKNSLSFLQKMDIPETIYMDTAPPAPAVDDDFLAGMLYAMYNGGPGHLEKYVQRSTGSESSYLSDRFFREKWAWVKQGDLDQIGLCLAGRPIPFEH
jgi:hypothetical protein